MTVALKLSYSISYTASVECHFPMPCLTRIKLRISVPRMTLTTLPCSACSRPAAPSITLLSFPLPPVSSSSFSHTIHTPQPQP